MQYLSWALELKSVEEGQFTGYASTFGNVDLQGDVVMPNAFDATLKQSKGVVPLLLNHDRDKVIGYGIDARQDEKGLHVTGELTRESTLGRDVYAMILHAQRVGHKPGLSIGYGVPKNGAVFNDKTGARELHVVTLAEYSITPFPANPKARIGRVKSDEEELSAGDLEDILREAGFSRVEAKAFLRRAKALREAASTTTALDDESGMLAALASSVLVDRFVKETPWN